MTLLLNKPLHCKMYFPLHFPNLIVIFNKIEDIDDTSDSEFCKAFDEFIEKKYKDSDTILAKKDQVKAVPLIYFDDKIKIKHEAEDKPFSFEWAKGENLLQAKELIKHIREKSNAPYKTPKTAKQ